MRGNFQACLSLIPSTLIKSCETIYILLAVDLELINFHYDTLLPFGKYCAVYGPSLQTFLPQSNQCFETSYLWGTRIRTEAAAASEINHGKQRFSNQIKSPLHYLSCDVAANRVLVIRTTQARNIINYV